MGGTLPSTEPNRLSDDADPEGFSMNTSPVRDLDRLVQLPQPDLIAEGKRLIASPRDIGLAIKLIPELSRRERHDEAVTLAEELVASRGRARDLNVLLSAVLRQGNDERIQGALERVSSFHATPQHEYEVQLISNWLRALFEIDQPDEFWRVLNEICAPEDRAANPFVVVQHLRMLNRIGRYGEVQTVFAAVPPDLQRNELVLQQLARSYVETGRLREADEIVGHLSESHVKRSLVADIGAARIEAGMAATTEDVIEVPGAHAAGEVPGKPTVFIVHGHDSRSKSELESLLHRIGANPRTFDSLPKKGSQTVIELLEEHIPVADAIVTLLTPDDEGRRSGDSTALAPRARENVLVEAGFAMISRRPRSVLVALGGVSIPSDFEGIHRVQDAEWSEGVAIRVAKRLREMGLAVSPEHAV